MSHVQKGEKTATRGDLDTEVKRTFTDEVKTKLKLHDNSMKMLCFTHTPQQKLLFSVTIAT